MKDNVIWTLFIVISLPCEAVPIYSFILLCETGLTGSIVLRSGRLSDLIVQLQELLTTVNEAESSPKYNSEILAAQVLQNEHSLVILI